MGNEQQQNQKGGNNQAKAGFSYNHSVDITRADDREIIGTGIKTLAGAAGLAVLGIVTPVAYFLFKNSTFMESIVQKLTKGSVSLKDRALSAPSSGGTLAGLDRSKLQDEAKGNPDLARKIIGQLSWAVGDNKPKQEDN